jgi:hypothetical protein
MKCSQYIVIINKYSLNVLLDFHSSRAFNMSAHLQEEEKMARKLYVIIVVLAFCAAMIMAASVAAKAACRDDCYSNCCGGDSLCQTDDEVKCLSDCLKNCGGDDVPDVPAPQPADGGDSSGGDSN